MQFLTQTFTAVVTKHPLPPGGDTPPSRCNPYDAVHAAAYYFCDNGDGDGRDLHDVIYTYSQADWYVRQVLDQAQKCRVVQPEALDPRRVGRAGAAPFGPRAGSVHKGQGIAAPFDTPILVAAGGTVIDSGPVSGYGLRVRIQHAIAAVTIYGHNNRNCVQSGQQVQAGQPITEVGNRGRSTGPHFHFR